MNSKKRVLLTLVILLLLSFGAISTYPNHTSASTDFVGCGGEIVSVVNADFEMRVVELVNEARAANGNLPPLKRTEEADLAARYHAADMGQDNYAGHPTFDRLNGDLVYICDPSDRVGVYYSGYGGENVAAGQNGTLGSTPEGAMELWMNSTGHRAAILAQDHWEIGVGYYYQASGSNFHHYWTQDFGNRRGAGVYPVVINREAGQTSTAVVSLYVYGKAVYGTGTAQQMRFKNENGSWSPWQPYHENTSWILSAGDGVKTVHSQIVRGGEVYEASDTIVLNEANPLPPTLASDVSQVSFAAQLPASAEMVRQVTLSNMGLGQIEWNATEKPSVSWLTLSSASGVVVRGDSQLLYLSVNPTGLAEGIYTTTVEIDGGAVVGSPISVPITFLYTSLPPVYLPVVTKS
ncbi:MAG: hypothetical protein KDE51_06155 [Anaerolineales bacterium]|nr:hypothetical protein [Anaerolineales bacterium]